MYRQNQALQQTSILFQVSDETRKGLRKIVELGKQKTKEIFEQSESLARELMSIKEIVPASKYNGNVPNQTDFVVTTIEFADSGMTQKKSNKGVKRNNHSAKRRFLN